MPLSGIGRSPIFWPAVMVSAGALLSPQMGEERLGWIALLALAAASMRKNTAGRYLFWFALSLFLATAYWVRPARDVGAWKLDGPLQMLVQVEGPWAESTGGWFARGRLEQIRRGPRIAVADLSVGLLFAGSERPRSYRRYRIVGTLRPPRRFYNERELIVGSWTVRVKSSRFVEGEGAPLTPGLIAKLRQALGQRIARLGADRPARGLVETLVLGRSRSLDPDWVRGLRSAGLGHVIAVSGLHLGLLAAVVWLTAARLPLRLRIGLSMSTVWLYAALVGDRPSVQRAAFMVSLLLLARLLRRPPPTLNALALATVVLPLTRPEWILDPGFRLSVAATAGILILGPRIVERWGLQESAVGKGLAISVAAHLATLPITVPLFLQFSLAGPLWNLLWVPWTAFVLICCMTWSILVAVLPDLAMSLAPLLDLLAAPFGLPAQLPPRVLGTVPVDASAAEALIAMALLMVAVVARGRWQVAAGLLSLLLLLPEGRPRRVEMVVLDVGQGDGLLFRDGDRTLLIDGGGWREGDFGSRVLRPVLVTLGVRSLDVAVVTHFDTDHCGGLAQVTGSLVTKQLWVTPSWGAGPCVRELLFDSRARTRVLWRGESVDWGAWSFRILHPPPGTVGSSNDRSLVLVAEAFGRRALLTGDVTRAVEMRLVEDDIAVDVLKVAHHGSRTSTSELFLRAARPRTASISVGVGNGYGHPAPEVLDRLRSHRIRVLRTDHDGMITWRFDERGVRVRVSGRGLGARTDGGPVRVVLPGLE